jgi:hypothetical protein
MPGMLVVTGMFDMTGVPGLGFVTVFQGLYSMGNEFPINMTILVGIGAIVTLQPLTKILKWIQSCLHLLFSPDTHHAASPHPLDQQDRPVQID